MKKSKIYNSEKAFDQAIFYYALDTFYAKPDPQNDDRSFVIVKNEDDTFVFHVNNEYLEEKAFEADLHVVHLRNDLL